jgi:exodeoxyribonuclease-5
LNADQEKALAADGIVLNADQEKALAADGIVLNADQEEALAAMLAFLADPEVADPFFVLTGCAGTGKTTVIRHLLEAQTGYTAILAAPTHKAVGVLDDLAGCAPHKDIGTVHSILGLTRRVAPDGTESFGPGHYYLRGLTNTSSPLLVVDECSMIGEELCEHIADAAECLDVRCIFMGDFFQLPPVNEPNSRTFEIKAGAELFEVMRHGGVLYEQVDRVRKAMQGGYPPEFAESAEDDQGRVAVMERLPWARSFLADVKSDRRVKALAWRNHTVEQINQWVRRSIYGKDVGRWVEGERLVAVDTFTKRAAEGRETTSIALHSEGECVVRGHKDAVFHKIPCTIVITDRGNFRVIEKEHEHVLEAALDQLKIEALRDQKWQPFFNLRDSFCKLRPAYATTVHKCQGSTYDTVYVHERDLLLNPLRNERERLLYVAYSRAQHELCVLR